MRGAVIFATVLVVLGLFLFRFYPNQNTYLFVPGVLVAFVLNGGGHEHTIFAGKLFWPTAIVANLAIYFCIAFGTVRLARMVRK
jgi:hypothetical protein